MTTRYRSICLAPGRAAPGITRARTIADREGNTLLIAGTVLDHSMLERLTRRGVNAISVLIPDTRDANAIAAEQHAIRSRIETIFRGSGSPAREALRAAVLDFRLEDTE